MDKSLDDLGQALSVARGDTNAEKAALNRLSASRVLVLLKQPPGTGDAAPDRNLVEWTRDSDVAPITPIFTANARLTIPIPPPFKLVATPMRALITTCGFRQYVVNPLSPDDAFEVDQTHWAMLKACIAEQGYEPDAPSQESPWAFSLPPDSLYPVAYALAFWLLNSRRADKAYMYQVMRMRSTTQPRKQIVLGLDEPLDLELAKTLTAVAVTAGASPESFVVRFLPEEPSHRNGIVRMQLEPFWLRPQPR